MTNYYVDCETSAKSIIARLGKKLVVGVPLGLGKPIGFLNAIYRLALEDQNIDLTILTALTLTRPALHTRLEKKFLEPIMERILGDYEDPLYEEDRLQQKLPNNIKVIEFFLSPGKYLQNASVQQDYISTNYTDAAKDVINRSINVIAQLVSSSATYPESYSLSCNTDLFSEVTFFLKDVASQGKPVAIVGEVNPNLPFMLGDAIVKSETFTDIVDTKKYRNIFAIPRSQLSIQDHLIGLYSSALVKDGSCLQIGIGKLGDAVIDALILRHKNNHFYNQILKQLHANDKFYEIIQSTGSLEPFEEGLYASTEMLSDGYTHLYAENILKKRVYDDINLQKLLNSKEITERVTAGTIVTLLNHKIINAKLTRDDFLFLQKFGIFKTELNYEAGNLILPNGELLPADLTQLESKNAIFEKCLGHSLKLGKITHAGFFLGSNEFYKQLKALPIQELERIEMTSIARTNRLCWSHELSQLQRQNARFINAAMMVTLESTIVSDGLENWQEVSGVGGQFDFATMAQQLKNARFIINCRSTRYTSGKVISNIVWDYPNITLSRNLRDIIITEYGIADCRSKTDSEIIKCILNITDSRFQQELLKTAKKFGKIPPNYEIPQIYQNNHPEKLESLIQEVQAEGYWQSYPFGTELTTEEQTLKNVLTFLKNCTRLKLIIVMLKAVLFFNNDIDYKTYLIRMDLLNPKGFRDSIYKRILKFLLNREFKSKRIGFFYE